MAYIVHSKFARDFDAMAARLEHWRAVHFLCRATLRLLLPVSYLGFLLCATLMFILPFKVLQLFRVTPPSVTYWVFAALISAFVLFVIWQTGRRIVWQWRQQVIDVELVVIFLGATLSAALIALIVPHGLH